VSDVRNVNCVGTSYHSVFDTVIRLRAGRSGVRIPPGTQDFPLIPNIQTGPGSHPVFYCMGTKVLPGGQSCRGVMLTTNFYAATWLRTSSALPLFTPHSFMGRTGTAFSLLG